ncbi:MAG: Na+/H+ antiporter subunit D, partial [Pseudomonadota bacterium]
GLRVMASAEFEAWIVAAVALAVGLLTIYSMTKIWAGAFWAPHPDGTEPSIAALSPIGRFALLSPIAALACLTIAIGLAPEPFVQFAETAAAQLLDPTAYVAAVLERAP